MTQRIETLQLPEKRLLLLDSLRDLADKLYQTTHWRSKTAAHRFWDSMRTPIEIIFDDLELDQDPEGQIDYSLYNEEEVQAVVPVVYALNRVIDEIGMKRPDAEYINSPLWDEVVKTAKHAFEVLMKAEVLSEYYKNYWNCLRQAFHKPVIPLKG